MKMKYYNFLEVIPFVYVSNTERELFNQPDEPTEDYLYDLIAECPELAGVRIIDLLPHGVDPEEAEDWQYQKYIFFEGDDLLFITRMIRKYNRVAHIMGDNGEEFCLWANKYRFVMTDMKDLEEYETFLYYKLKSNEWKAEYEESEKAFQQSLVEDEKEFYEFL